MIILSTAALFFSFLLQGIMSNNQAFSLNNLSWFITIYPLITLLILVPHFENSKKRLLLIIIVGLLIDLVYTNTGILNALIFVIAYYASKSFHFFFPYNLFTINISNILSITIYHIISFLFLYLLKFDRYTIMILLKVISHSLIMTIMYSSIMYLIINILIKNLNIKEVK